MPKNRPNSPTSKPGDAAPGNCARQPCPLQCQPISDIKVVSVTFTTDHDLLKNDAANWKNEGVRYPKPEWTLADAGSVGAPITHTMDRQVGVRVVVEVQPPNACPESGTFEGHGPEGLVFSPVAAAWKPGQITFTLTSSSKLPRSVKRLRLDLQWTAVAQSGRFDRSSADYCFITMDTPINNGAQEDGVTLRRMFKAVELVEPMATLDPHTIVERLMQKIPYYTLVRDPAVPGAYKHPTYFNNEGGAWPIGDYMGSYAECQAIVRFVHGVINQIGCPGTVEAVVIWADPNVNNGATVLENPLGSATLHGRQKTIDGKLCRVALAATTATLAVGQTYPTGSMMNMYEACLKFTHNGVTKYYGGGAGKFDTKEQVIRAFAALVWYSQEVQPDGSIKNRIEEIVHTF